MTLRTNKDKLVEMAVQGRVANPVLFSAFDVGHDGVARAVPSVGGITYNVKVGDPAFGWEGDHIEPAVSAILDEKERMGKPNLGFNHLACTGNEAILVSGEAKGEKGVVIGKHGGAQHVMIDFDDETLGKMCLDDKILIRGYGQGFKLTDFEDIKLYNLGPQLFDQWKITQNRDGSLAVPVAAVLPGKLMGSGLGWQAQTTGDIDLHFNDRKQIDQYGVSKLRFGDLVAVTDFDSAYGYSWREGAISIGVIVHSDSYLAGHGPGVTMLMTTCEPLIEPKISAAANVGQMLKCGRWRKPKRKPRIGRKSK